MTGAALTAEFRDAQIRGAVAQLRFALGRPEALTRPIGVRLAENAQDRFRAERAPDGTPWQRLNPVYAEVKQGPGILRGPNWSRSGLNASITSAASGWDVSVGSNKVHAAVHQFGAMIRPKRGAFLTLRLPNGAIWGVAQQVTIPARPYLGLSAEDQQDVLDIVEDFADRQFRAGPAARP